MGAVPDAAARKHRVHDGETYAPGMQMTTAVRRLLACSGGLLAGAVLGAELMSPDGSVKGMFAGLGVGLLVAALVPEDRR